MPGIGTGEVGPAICTDFESGSFSPDRPLFLSEVAPGAPANMSAEYAPPAPGGCLPPSIIREVGPRMECAASRTVIQTGEFCTGKHCLCGVRAAAARAELARRKKRPRQACLARSSCIFLLRARMPHCNAPGRPLCRTPTSKPGVSTAQTSLLAFSNASKRTEVPTSTLSYTARASLWDRGRIAVFENGGWAANLRKPAIARRGLSAVQLARTSPFR